MRYIYFDGGKREKWMRGSQSCYCVEFVDEFSVFDIKLFSCRVSSEVVFCVHCHVCGAVLLSA